MNRDTTIRRDPSDQTPQRPLMAATPAAAGRDNLLSPRSVLGRPIAVGSIASPTRVSLRHLPEARLLRDSRVRFGAIGALGFAAIYFAYWVILLLEVGSPGLMLFAAINTIGFLSLLALLQALCWSAALGLVVGVIVALFRDYLLGRRERRHLA